MTLKPTVFSPLAGGNGAHVVHSILASQFPSYEICTLSPKQAAIPQLLRKHRKKADIIHTIPEYGSVFFRNDAKNVVTFHNYFWDSAYRPYCSLAQRLYYRLFQFSQVTKAVAAADAVTTVSEFTATLIRDAFPRADVQVICNGVDTERFAPANKPAGDEVRILFSGNVSRRKGGHTLLAIADQLPDNSRLIVTGGLRGRKESLSHPRIEFVNRVPYEKMQELYQQCDILLLPSYREGLSLSVLEAMACGLAVVSYDASSMRELIDHGKGGFLGEPYNPGSLAGYLRQLSGSRETIIAMGHYNRQHALERFTLSNMIDAYEKLFNSLYED